MVESVANATAESYKDGGGSDPQLIADVVSKAIDSEKPKTRYVAGKFARLMLFVRKWFGDRAFDSMVMSTVK